MTNNNNDNTESTNREEGDPLLNGKIEKKELELAEKILRNGKAPGIDTL